MTIVRMALAVGLLAILPAAGACGGAKTEEKPGSRATVAIEGTTYAVSNVKFVYHPGEHGHFRIAGEDAGHVNEECAPGVRSGLVLSGNLPSGVNSPAELSDKEVAFDFSGDGGNHNLCFVGAKGPLGIEKGMVTFGHVYGGAIAFTFSTLHASGSGTAAIE